MIPKLKMPGSKHSVLGIIQVTIDKIIVSITGFTTIDHRGTIALDEKLLNPTISQVTGSRINIKGKKGILGTFIKYYKISQLIHTQSIAN